CEKENDVYRLTFNASCPPEWDRVSVSADFFMELFPTQSNIISLWHGRGKRFSRVTKSSTTFRTEF
ncbi:MAG: hypothetical protein R3350_04640, partial [Saprospiraceae bacterium]|nr:hypothetical protein [Saprospiraceae bacterium]